MAGARPPASSRALLASTFGRLDLRGRHPKVSSSRSTRRDVHSGARAHPCSHLHAGMKACMQLASQNLHHPAKATYSPLRRWGEWRQDGPNYMS
eukprot:6172254-Pleurochrysis_carterae.AAC.1